MLNTLTYDGEWWLSQQPETKFKGKFRFTPQEGSSLELFNKDPFEIPPKNDLILGLSADGQKITLYNCRTTYEKVFPGFFKEGHEQKTVIPEFALIGVHLNSICQLQFERIAVHFNHLDDWVGVYGFKTKLGRKRVSIVYKTPDSINFSLNNDLSIELSFELVSSLLSPHPRTEISIGQKAWLSFYYSDARPIESFLTPITVMRNFITLALSQPTYLTDVTAFCKSAKTRFFGKEGYAPIQVLFQQGLYVLEPSGPINSLSILFDLNQIANKQVLANWFSKIDLLQPMSDLYFATLYQTGMYPNNEFLNLIQALESYHRRLMNNFELPPEEHKKRVAEILQNTPGNYKDWLSNKLAFSNEPSLAKRLRELWEKCPIEVKNGLGDKNDFVRLTVNTRNYLTHFGDVHKTGVKNDGELRILTWKLRILVQACMLNELSFDPYEVQSLLARQLINLFKLQKAIEILS